MMPPEMQRVFLSACYVMNGKALRRDERALGERVMLQVFMRHEMPSADDVEAVDALCDQVLENMRSTLAAFVLAERKARRALVEGHQ